MKKLFFIMLLFIVVSSAYGDILVFTDKAQFDSAIAGLTQGVEDFEGVTSGTEFIPGSSIGWITFTFSIPGNLIVANDWDATSGENYLGVAGDRTFLSGDTLDLTFDQPVHAVGLYVMGSPGDIHENDIELADTDTLVQNSSTLDLILPNSGEAFFIGFVDNSFIPHTSVSLISNAMAGYEFQLDDIITAYNVEVDQDGYINSACGGDDCDDTNPNVNPGMVEIQDNGLDDDCNPSTLDIGFRGSTTCFISTASAGALSHLNTMFVIFSAFFIGFIGLNNRFSK
jgi:hypothetical protein